MKSPALSAALVIASALAACGDNHETPAPDAGMPPVDSGLDEDGCRILELGPRDFQFNIFEQLLGVKFPVTPNLDGNRSDALLIELYDSTTPELPPLTTGTFDLATNTDLATCQHCVWVELDAPEDAPSSAVYFATQGTITIDKISDPLDAVFAAHTSRIVLRRASFDEEGHSQLVPGGDCVSITGVSFDTTPTPNQACESAEDCGNALLEICDPSNNKCAPPECSFDVPCAGDNELCLVQYGQMFEGACYQLCNPSAATSGCSVDQQCVQRGPIPTDGICKYTGTGAPGSTCVPEDNGTSCADASICSGESRTCAATCDFYEQDPGCPANTLCSVLWLCEPPSVGVSVGVGAACGPDATLAQGCAPDGEAFRGLCFGFEGDPLVCEKACLGNEGCASDQFCATRFSSGVGICRPVPVCGDGALGEINEVCDDGNLMDGDGCSADCQTVDVGYLCNAASSLALGVPTQRSTATGVDGLMSSCQAGIARATLFDVAPPGPGRLRLHLTSQTSQTLSARNTCEDASTELACRAEFGVPTDQELIVQITDTTPAALTAMVSAMTVIDEGPYTIEAQFLPEDCDDGVLEGREVCDDSNQAANDGCSADCRTIEYDVLCTQAPALSTSATNAGMLDGALMSYGASCAIDEGRSLRPSRMHTFQAPAAGTLSLKLTDGTSFAVLSLRDGCGAPDAAPETACRPAFLDGELSVTMAAGETITAVVTSYYVDDAVGTYTLDATFAPQ
jgi:cysteine-rich repeat protein